MQEIVELCLLLLAYEDTESIKNEKYQNLSKDESITKIPPPITKINHDTLIKTLQNHEKIESSYESENMI